jgi:hypothetical protein
MFICLLKSEFSSREVSILGLNAKGFLMRIYSFARSLSSSCLRLLLHPLQAQFDPQNLLLAKHSQYSFRHLDFLQLQVLHSPDDDEVLYYLESSEFTKWPIDGSLRVDSSILLRLSSLQFLINFGTIFSRGSFSCSILSRIFLASTALLIEEMCLLLFGLELCVIKFNSSSIVLVLDFSLSFSAEERIEFSLSKEICSFLCALSFFFLFPNT